MFNFVQNKFESSAIITLMLIDIATRRSPKYWHDCAAHVRAKMLDEPNPHLRKLMEGCADDYERLGKRAEEALADKLVRVF